MRRGIACMLVLTVAFSLAAAPTLVAQTEKDQKSGLDRIEGTIQSIDEGKRSMRVRRRNRNNMFWTVVYTDETAITYRNEDSTAEDLRAGRRVIALGRFAEGSLELRALRIDIRSGR